MKSFTSSTCAILQPHARKHDLFLAHQLTQVAVISKTYFYKWTFIWSRSVTQNIEISFCLRLFNVKTLFFFYFKDIYQLQTVYNSCQQETKKATLDFRQQTYILRMYEELEWPIMCESTFRVRLCVCITSHPGDRRVGATS